MALSIKTEEADRLARVLSQLTGESLTRAVTIALRERLEREHRAECIAQARFAQTGPQSRGGQVGRNGSWKPRLKSRAEL